MKKYLQNRIAESGLLLPAMVGYAVAVWIAAGLLANGWWAQIVVSGISVYLMVELSNANTLLRVRSRMVSSVYLMLSSLPVALFGSFPGAVAGLCFVGTIVLLFRSYQDKTAVGLVFYAFLLMGLASLGHASVLFLVPLLWLLMATHLQCLGWRTWRASVLGLLTPYWLALPWVLYARRLDMIRPHFAGLVSFGTPFDYASLSRAQLLNMVFILVLLVMGAFHFWTNSIDEKVRIRQLFGFFISLCLFTVLLLAVLPQHYEPLVRMLVIAVSPLVAHFFALTHSRASNIAFFVVIALAALLQVVNLYPASLTASQVFLSDLWSGLLSF